MLGAHILVDNQLAPIIERTPLIVTLQVPYKEHPIKITAKKDNLECSTQQILPNHRIRIQICQ